MVCCIRCGCGSRCSDIIILPLAKCAFPTGCTEPEPTAPGSSLRGPHYSAPASTIQPTFAGDWAPRAAGLGPARVPRRCGADQLFLTNATNPAAVAPPIGDARPVWTWRKGRTPSRWRSEDRSRRRVGLRAGAVILAKNRDYRDGRRVPGGGTDGLHHSPLGQTGFELSVPRRKNCRFPLRARRIAGSARAKRHQSQEGRKVRIRFLSAVRLRTIGSFLAARY